MAFLGGLDAGRQVRQTLRPSGDGDAVALGEAKPAAGRPLVVIMLHTQLDRLELGSDHIDMQRDAEV